MSFVKSAITGFPGLHRQPMSVLGTSAIDIRGIVVNICSSFRYCILRPTTTSKSTVVRYNGLRHASQPPQASYPRAPDLAAHAVDCDLDHEPPARPATSPSIPALSHPQVDTHRRLPRHSAQPDPATAAPEDHRNHQRPRPSARPRLRPWQLPLEL